jgi:hypothetical protein
MRSRQPRPPFRRRRRTESCGRSSCAIFSPGVSVLPRASRIDVPVSHAKFSALIDVNAARSTLSAENSSILSRPGQDRPRGRLPTVMREALLSPYADRSSGSGRRFAANPGRFPEIHRVLRATCLECILGRRLGVLIEERAALPNSRVGEGVGCGIARRIWLPQVGAVREEMWEGSPESLHRHRDAVSGSSLFVTVSRGRGHLSELNVYPGSGY